MKQLTWTAKAQNWMTKKLKMQPESLELQNFQSSDFVAFLQSSIRFFIEKELLHFWQQEYTDYLNDTENDRSIWKEQQIDRLGSYPEAVKQAIQFYLEKVEYADWGSVRLYQLTFTVANFSEVIPTEGDIDFQTNFQEEMAALHSQEFPFYVVKVTTDGDDGWLELFDNGGLAIGFGRTYVELVGWETQEEIRGFVEGGGFPDSLVDRGERTLWGK